MCIFLNWTNPYHFFNLRCKKMGGLDFDIQEDGLCQCKANLESEPLKLSSNENDSEKYNK